MMMMIMMSMQWMSGSWGPLGDVHQFLSVQVTKRPCAASKGLNFVSEHHEKYTHALLVYKKTEPAYLGPIYM